MISWRGLELEVGEDAALEGFRLAGHSDEVLHRVAVRFAEGWRSVGTELLLDEVEQRLECEGATAVVRHVFDDTWSIRVQIANQRDEPVTVPPLWLEVDSAWPLRRWLAGAEGSISVDADREDGALLTFTQLRGRSRLSEGCCWLTDLPIRLAPRGTTGSVYQVSWRADWLRDERMQAAALPTWWPERTVLADGDAVELRLPDAAVEGAGIGILEDDEVTVLSAQPGVHLAQIHAGRGTTDVELAWQPAEAQLLGEAADRLLRRDPRTLAGHEVFLLGRCLAADSRGAGGQQVVDEAAEELTARPGPVPPLALAAVADRLLRTGDPALAAPLAAMLSRLGAVPGAVLAMLHANLALQLAGHEPVVASFTGGGHDGGGGASVLAEALRRTELLALRPPSAMPRQAVRVAALLGAGLPGVTVDQSTRALVWAITGALPETWQDGADGPGERWPVSLGTAREIARGRLLAERCDDLALAWLQW